MKFGIREICDVVLRAKAAQEVGNKIFYKGEPVLYFDSLKTSSLESQATTVYAQGGRGNARLIAWEGERTVTFTMEDALISPEGIAVLTGASLMDATETNPIITHETEITDKFIVYDNYVEINLKNIPYIEAGNIDDFRYVLLSVEENEYDSTKTYYKMNGEQYTEIDFLNKGFEIYINAQMYDENGQPISQNAVYDSNTTYWTQNHVQIQPSSFIADGFGVLYANDQIYKKESGSYQRANDNGDFIYVMLLDDNGEIISEPYIASEVELNSNVVYIYKTETGNIFEENLQESDVSITRINDIDKFKNVTSILVDYYVKKESGSFQIDIAPDSFSGNFYLEASTLFRSTDGVDMPAEFIIPNCKIQSNFTFTMASSGDPSTFTFTMDAFPDYTRWNKNKKVYAAIQVINQDEVTKNFERLGTKHNYINREECEPFRTYNKQQAIYLGDQPQEIDNLIFTSIDENGNIYNNGLGYRKGYKITSSSPIIDNLNEYTVSGFIPYKYNQTILISGGANESAVSQRLCFYDNNFAYIAYASITQPLVEITNLDSIISNNESLNQIKQTAKYIRVSLKNQNIRDMVVQVTGEPYIEPSGDGTSPTD